MLRVIVLCLYLLFRFLDCLVVLCFVCLVGMCCCVLLLHCVACLLLYVVAVCLCCFSFGFVLLTFVSMDVRLCC